MLWSTDGIGNSSPVIATIGGVQQLITLSAADAPKGGRGAYWAHPVVFGGRLYIRHSEQLFVYNIVK